MKRLLSLALVVAVAGTAGSADAKSRDFSSHSIAIQGDGVIETSASSQLFFKAAVGGDSFALYGTSDNFPEGKFSDVNQVLPDMQSWTGVDNTDNDFNPWHVSTFNSPTGTLAAWCGLDSSDPMTAGWVTTPGYANNWVSILEFRAAPTNSAVANNVDLSFVYNYSTEPGFDFFSVAYDSNGSFVEVLSTSGDNRDTNGVHQPVAAALVLPYSGGDYAGNGDIAIRVIFSSDGAYSDADGAFVSATGGAQVDDLVVVDNSGAAVTYTTDFNDGLLGDWSLTKAEFAGDFAGVFSSFSDLDPCRENTSPVLGFIDNNSPVSNADAIPYYGTAQTGGATSANWLYGIPGSWVVNYEGGLSQGIAPLNNDVQSPTFVWDLPGTADDDPNVSGALFSFDVYRHQPLVNGIFYTWGLASSTDGGTTFGEFLDRGFVYYSSGFDWLRSVNVVTDLVLPGVTDLQIRIGCVDLADIFGFAVGDDATPAPIFDNVSFIKFRIGGASFSTRTIDLFQDSFPQGGGIDASDDLARDLLDIRIDMARDINSGDVVNTPGDSLIVDVVPVIPGTSVAMADISMEWVLDLNPLFSGVRVMPAGATLVAAGAANGWDQWTGSVLADSSTTNAGSAIEDRFYFDAPDADFMYPGDLFRYYVRAEDSAANVTTLPGNIAGFADGNGYSRTYTVRGLPSIVDDGLGGTSQPGILLVNDFGRRGGENDYLQAFNQNGLNEGVEYDSYTVQGPSSGVSNGIGSEGAHGANALQLADYDCIVYVSGNLGSFTLSEGDGTDGGDKGNDIGVLTDWHNLAGDRFAAFFGDAISSDLAGLASGAGTSFLQNVLAVTVNDNIVRDDIDGQTAPVVVGALASFTSSYVAFGGCLGINDFDNIVPSGTGVAGHDFLTPNGLSTYANSKASVVHDRLVGTDRKVDVTFPYGLIYVWSDANTPSATTKSAKAVLLAEVFGLFGNPHAAGVVTGNEGLPSQFDGAFASYPNPFNPMTSIKYTTGLRSKNVVKVYDSMGRLVRTLVSEMRDAGAQVVQWNGTDDSGASVASGVYMFEVLADGETGVHKGVLLK